MEAARAALMTFNELGMDKLEAMMWHLIAKWQMEEGKIQEAMESATKSLTIYELYGKGFEAVVLKLLIDLHLSNHDVQQALRLAMEGLEKYRALGDARAEVVLLQALVCVHCEEQNMELAMTTLETAIMVCRVLGDDEWLAQLLLFGGQVYRRADNLEAGIPVAKESMLLYLEVGELRNAGCALHLLTEMHANLDMIEAALETIKVVQKRFDSPGDPAAKIHPLVATSVIHLIEGRFVEAARASSAARKLGEETKDQFLEALACQALTDVHTEARRYDDAVEVTKRRLEIWRELGDRKAQIDCLNSLARLHLDLQNPKAAFREAQEAQMLCQMGKHRFDEAASLLLFVEANMKIACDLRDDHVNYMREVGQKLNKATRGAKEVVKIAKELATETRPLGIQGSGHYWLAQVLQSQKLNKEALESIDEALVVFQSLGDKPGEAACLVLGGQVHHANSDLTKAVEMVENGRAMYASVGDQESTASVDRILEEMRGQSAVVVVRSAGAPAEVPVEVPEESMETQKTLIPLNSIIDTVSVIVKDIVTDSDVGLDVSLLTAGIDSLSSLDFRNSVSREFGMPLPAQMMFDYPTVREVADYIFSIQ